MLETSVNTLQTICTSHKKKKGIHSFKCLLLKTSKIQKVPVKSQNKCLCVNKEDLKHLIKF